jgi:hypothetical protein
MRPNDLAIALDPAHLMRVALGVEPDLWQRDFLRTMASGRAKEAMLLCCRQSGKSTTVAALAVHTAMFAPNSLVLLLSATLRQAGELYGKVKTIARRVSDDVPDAESSTRLELTNGSRVVSLPGSSDTIRGFSGPRLIVLDEAAYIDDTVNDAIRPMLAVGGGSIVLVSTPHGARGFFWDAWTNGGPDWHRTRITADDCPRITPEFLAKESARLSSRAIRQEYYCEFVDVDEQVFSTDLIRAALSYDVQTFDLEEMLR